MKAGFVIANDKEEFLIHAEIDQAKSVLLWSTHPGDALCWDAYKYARMVADKLLTSSSPLYVLQLIESEEKYFVTVPLGRFVSGPEWLKVTLPKRTESPSQAKDGPWMA